MQIQIQFSQFIRYAKQSTQITQMPVQYADFPNCSLLRPRKRLSWLAGQRCHRVPPPCHLVGVRGGLPDLITDFQTN